MQNQKIINIFSKKSASTPLNVDKLFDMTNVINDCQDDLIRKTLIETKFLYDRLSLHMRSRKQNEFILQIMNIFKEVIDDPDLIHQEYTYLLLLYFIDHYIPLIEVRKINGDIIITGKPRTEDDLMVIALMNVLISNCKTVIDMQNIKPISLLYQILVLYDIPLGQFGF